MPATPCSASFLSCYPSPVSAPAFADERADTQRQLEQTQKDIGELKKLLDGIQQEKSGVQKQLKSTETEMGDLENRSRPCRTSWTRAKPS